MKYLIVGLGNFGSSLGEKLTKLGNEVIGVDVDMDKVNLMKERMTHTVCLNSTDPDAMASLPIKNTDVAIVCIGEDQGVNIMTTAILKNMNVKRLISRSLNPLHENVLQAIGVTEIARPEEESAERWVKKLVLKNVIDSFELNENYSIVEVLVPHKLVGKTIEEIGLRQKFNVLILTVMKEEEVHTLIGHTKIVANVKGIPSPDTCLEEGDILVVYGANKDIRYFANLS